MARIFADTNVWLDFYESPKTTLTVFTDLASVADQFVFTQQLTEEILRNRGRLLTHLAKKYRKPNLDFPSPAVVESARAMGRFEAARVELGAAAKEVARSLEEMLADSSKDPVISALSALFVAEGAMNLSYDAELVDRAHRRKLTGQPPGSGGGHLGDELHWEIILASFSGEDLRVVSRDSTFHDNLEILASEFNEKTGGDLAAVDRELSTALDEEKLSVPESVREAEAEIRELRVDPGRWSLISRGSDWAIVTDGGRTGATPIGRSVGGECPSCGLPGPWNGSTCLSCGSQLSD